MEIERGPKLGEGGVSLIETGMQAGEQEARLPAVRVGLDYLDRKSTRLNSSHRT